MKQKFVCKLCRKKLPVKEMDTLTAKEVAKILKVNERTVRRWAESGEIKSIKISGAVRIMRESLEKCERGER